MALTKEDLTAALANPEAAEYKVLQETLQERNLSLLTSEEKKKVYDDERERSIGDITKKIYGDLDKDLMDSSGLKKSSDEKTYDFAKRVVTTFKGSVSEYEKKIQDLEKKISEGSQDQTLKAQLEHYQKKEAEWQATIQEKDTALFRKDVSLDINTSIKGLKFQQLPKVLLDAAVEREANILMSTAKVEGGKVVYSDSTGRVIIDDKGSPATAEYILKERLKDIIDTGRQQAGAGSGSNGDQPRTFARFTSVPAGVETQGQLMDVMSKSGYIKGSKEYNEDYGRLSVGLRLR